MDLLYIPIIDLEKTGVHLKELRLKNSLSVEDLLMYFPKLSSKAIYNWESGADIPKLSNLYVLSNLYGISICELFICQLNSVCVEGIENLQEINMKLSNDKLSNSKLNDRTHVCVVMGEQEEALKDIGNNLKQYKKNHHINNKFLIKLLNVSTEQTIFNWESGKNLPDINNALILSRLYEVPIEELLPITLFIVEKLERR